MKLKLKAVPGATQDKIAGWLGDTLKVRVQAPPEKGKANKAIEKMLARELGLPTKNAEIISGKTSPFKTIEISALNEAEILAQLPDKGETSC